MHCLSISCYRVFCIYVLYSIYNGMLTRERKPIEWTKQQWAREKSARELHCVPPKNMQGRPSNIVYHRNYVCHGIAYYKYLLVFAFRGEHKRATCVHSFVRSRESYKIFPQVIQIWKFIIKFIIFWDKNTTHRTERKRDISARQALRERARKKRSLQNKNTMQTKERQRAKKNYIKIKKTTNTNANGVEHGQMLCATRMPGYDCLAHQTYGT